MGEPDPSAGDPHAVLGVAPDTPPEQIRVAAAKAKREYNPDAYPDPEKRAAREAFYEIVAAERALLDGTPDPDSAGATTPGDIDRPATPHSDEPSTDHTTPGTTAETTRQTAETAEVTRQTAETVETTRRTTETTQTETSEPTLDTTTRTEPSGAEQPVVSFPESERRRFDPDGGVRCRVVGAVSREPLSGFRLYADRVGGDDSRTVADDGADAVLELSPGRWQICAERTDERHVAAPTADSAAGSTADLATASTVDSATTPTPDSASASTPDPVAVTVVQDGPGNDTATDGRRLDGRTLAVVSSLAAVTAVGGVAGVVLSVYLGVLPTVPSAVASGVVCVAGVVSYLRTDG